MAEHLVDDASIAIDPARATPLGRRAGRGMLWGQASKMLEALLTLAVAVAAVRALNPNAFGLYSLLTYLAGAASVVIPVVTVEAVAAVLPRYRRARERLSLTVVIAAVRLVVIGSALLVILPAWEHVRGVVGLEAISYRVFLVGAVYWILQDLLTSVSSFFLVELDLRPVALWRPLGQAVTFVAIVVIAATEDRWSSSVGEVLAAVAAGAAVSLAGLLWSAKRYGVPFAPSRESVRHVLSFTRSTWVIGILTFALATHVDVLLIGALTGNPREVAFYVAAAGIVARAQFLFLSGWVAVLLPALGEARARGGASDMARVWQLFAKVWLFATLPTNVLLLVVAGPLIETLFGEGFAPAGGLLAWVAAFNIATALFAGQLGVAALWALDAQPAVMRVRLVTAPLSIALATALILWSGALGAVIATGVTAVATAAIEFWLARRRAPLELPLGFLAGVGASCVAAAVPALVLDTVPAVELVLGLALGAAAYLAAAAVARPFSDDDFRVLAGVSPRLATSPLRMFART